MRPDPSIPQLLFRSVARADVRSFPKTPTVSWGAASPAASRSDRYRPRATAEARSGTCRVSKVSKRSRAALPGSSQRDSGRLHRPPANLRRGICGDGQRSRFVCRQGLLTERMDGSNQRMELVGARHRGLGCAGAARHPSSVLAVPGQAPCSSTLCRPCEMKPAGAQTSARP
jgi:hypothetical protein